MKVIRPVISTGPLVNDNPAVPSSNLKFQPVDKDLDSMELTLFDALSFVKAEQLFASIKEKPPTDVIAAEPSAAFFKKFLRFLFINIDLYFF